MKRRHIPQSEFGFTAGTFNLIGETVTQQPKDEQQELERKRQAAAKETPMFEIVPNNQPTTERKSL